MLLKRFKFLRSCFLFTAAVFSPQFAVSQSAGPPSFSRATAMPCDVAFRAVQSADGEPWPSPLQRAPFFPSQDCSAEISAAIVHHSYSASLFESPSENVPSAKPADPSALSSVPKHFYIPPSLAAAREAVAEILNVDNSCSQWLRRFDPDIVATFQSLSYRIEATGPDYAIQEPIDGTRTEHGPYSARTTQGAGPGALVTLNGNGPFFRSRLNLHIVKFHGAVPLQTGNYTFAHVGPYEGGSFRAQITILLHELAHVAGAIPEDDSSKFGFRRSQNNTATVLSYCKATADTFVRNNAVVLRTAAFNDPYAH